MILYSYGYSEHVVIAGLLHDVVEDTTYTIDDISDAFGERVAMIVAAVTEDKGVSSRAGRKKLYLDNLANADNDTKAVCAADMLHNRLQVLDEIASGFKIWEHRDIGVDLYLQESYDKLRVIQETLNDELVLELESVLGQIRKS